MSNLLLLLSNWFKRWKRQWKRNVASLFSSNCVSKMMRIESACCCYCCYCLRLIHSCVCVSVYCVLMMSSFVPLFKWRSAAAAADCVCPRFLLLLSKMKFCLASQLVSPLVAFPSATTAGDWNVIAELWCFSLFPGKRRRNTHTNSRYSPFLLFLPSSSCCFSGCLYTN